MMELGSTLSGFGKGSLSRTIPVFGTDAPEAFRGKAARQRAKATRKREALETNANEVDSSEPCLEIPFAKNSVAVDMCRLLSSPVMDNPLEEHLQLCLWEAFYASFISKKLRILDASDSVTEWTDPNETYAYFCRLDSKFPYYLAVYCYYRQRGWSPHSGLKYGTDFVLYYGTVENHIHSPFCVLVDIHKDDSYDNCLLDKSWISLQNRLRLVKQVR